MSHETQQIAVVTGATGLLGANLAIALLQAGHRVICTHRASSRIDHLQDFPIEWKEADVTDEEALFRACQGADVLFHCAAVVQMFRHPTPLMQRTNVEGTRHILSVVKRAKIKRLVYCSSVVAKGLATGETLATEETPWNFPERGLIDAYSSTKRQAEQLVQDAVSEGLDAVIVNPSTMVGPYDQKPSTGKIVRSLLKRRIPGYTYGWNSFVDARAVAQGMIAAWHKGRTGESYLLCGENLSFRDFFARIARVAGVRPVWLPLPYSLLWIGSWFGELYQRLTKREALLSHTSFKYAYCKDFRYSIEKARKELGYDPGDLDQGIQDTITWFKQNGML
jgi:dihydroflavonol-4-reductase